MLCACAVCCAAACAETRGDAAVSEDTYSNAASAKLRERLKELREGLKKFRERMEEFRGRMKTRISLFLLNVDLRRPTVSRAALKCFRRPHARDAPAALESLP